MWITPDDYKAVGECLAAVRKRAGVSQDELAALLGKPQSFVSAYERGQRRIDVLEMLVVLRALNAEPMPVFSDIVKSARDIQKLKSKK